MPRSDNEVRVSTSILDRLIDYEPEVSREAIGSRSKTLRDLKQSVMRDLEWLLNTRQVADGIPEDLKETCNSVANYGLPDFTVLSTESSDDQQFIKHEIEDAIRRFEQRLEAVVVTVDAIPSPERIIRFRIDARLRTEPTPEPITFDTVLQLGSGEYHVRTDL